MSAHIAIEKRSGCCIYGALRYMLRTGCS